MARKPEVQTKYVKRTMHSTEISVTIWNTDSNAVENVEMAIPALLPENKQAKERIVTARLIRDRPELNFKLLTITVTAISAHLYRMDVERFRELAEDCGPIVEAENLDGGAEENTGE